MMTRMDDLSLSLSLGGAREEASPLHLNLMPSLGGAAPPAAFLAQQKVPASSAPWNDLFAPSSSVGGGGTRPFLKGIDVNRVPVGERVTPEEDAEEEEEDAGVSSPNSTVSSAVSGGGGGGGIGSKRSDRGEDPADLHACHRPRHRPNSCSIGDESELARTGSRSISDEEDGGDGVRKKLRLSKDQSAILEESFKEHNTLNPKQKLALAKQLNLRPRQVEVWFQNRRARTKLKQTEVDCEFLKRCCENLTEENRRLQKEVQELRALKLSPQLYMHMTPPTTLTMCPSCERVAVSPATHASAAPASTSSSPPADSRASHHRQHPFPHPPPPQLHGSPSPRALLPAPHRPIPTAPGGVPAAGHALPWAPTPLRPAAFVGPSADRRT